MGQSILFNDFAFYSMYKYIFGVIETFQFVLKDVLKLLS